MARDWVKLHTSMLGHAGTMMLPDRAFRLWIVLLLMAGMTDDDGRAGTVGEIAFNLRTGEADTLALLATLNGRAVVQDGVVYVRDWSEWQPKQDPTAAKRQADFRTRRAEEVEALRAAANVIDVPARDVTPLRHDVTNAATRARDSLIQPEEPPPTPPAVANGGCGADAPRWEPVTTWAVERFGEPATLKNDSTLRAWVGQLCRTIGPTADNDPAAAVRLLEGFYRQADRDGTWRYVTTANIHERVGKWLADRAASTNTGYSAGLSGCVSAVSTGGAA